MHIRDIGGFAGNRHGPGAIGAAVELDTGGALRRAFNLAHAFTPPLFDVRGIPLHPTQLPTQRPGLTLISQPSGVALDGQQRGKAVPIGASGGDGFALEAAKRGRAEVGIGEGEQAGGGGVGAAGLD